MDPLTQAAASGVLFLTAVGCAHMFKVFVSDVAGMYRAFKPKPLTAALLQQQLSKLINMTRAPVVGGFALCPDGQVLATVFSHKAVARLAELKAMSAGLETLLEQVRSDAAALEQKAREQKPMVN
jgi:hypothetical protein